MTGAERIGGGVREEEAGPDTDIEYVDAPVQHKGRPGDLAFRTMPAHAQTRYAIALEKKSVAGDVEPQWGDVARNAWEEALAEWVKFGDLPEFPAFSHPDQMVRLDDITDQAKYDSTDRAAAVLDRALVQRHQLPLLERPVSGRGRTPGRRRAVACSTRPPEPTRRPISPTAVEKYQQGLELWENLLDHYPAYRDDELNRRDMGEIVRRYANALRQIGEELPEDTPFYDAYLEIKDMDPAGRSRTTHWKSSAGLDDSTSAGAVIASRPTVQPGPHLHSRGGGRTRAQVASRWPPAP